MTMLCIPLPSLNHVPQTLPLQPDLIELQRADHKILRDTEGHLRFVDYDWRSTLPDADGLILSYHNHEETPPDLEDLLKTLRSKGKAQYYKIATFAQSTLDALRMLEFVQKHPDVIGLCMGIDGQATRILAPLVGTPIMYAALSPDLATAPGQLSIEELTKTYHFRLLSKTTPIYAVIGDPVTQSPGPLYHNQHMKGDGIYVKLRIAPHELSSFFSYVRRLPFKGLSVTIPHKVSILPYLDAIDPQAQEIGAVNTIDIHNGLLKGYNTDAEGALGALGDVEGKHAIVLGAGGAAQAIIYALLQRGAQVTIVNRTPEKARALAEKFHCHVGDQKTFEQPYDIVIQATSESAAAPLKKETTVMDISLSDTPFLDAARKLGCPIIAGMEMYIHQAEGQRKIWNLY